MRGTSAAPSAIGRDGIGVVKQVSEYHNNALPELDPDAAAFRKRFTGKDDEFGYYRLNTAFLLFAAAANKARSNDPIKVAKALEGMKLNTTVGEVEMRADNHQLLQPLFVSTFSDNVKYDVERTGLGFKTDAKVNARDTALPTTCQMQRPQLSRRPGAPRRLCGAMLAIAGAPGSRVLEIITFSLLNGVVYGLLLFMVSSGLTLIFSMMGVLNFAHASMFMLGAYFSYQIGRWIGFWPALVIAPLLVGAVGAAVERFGLRHVHRQGHVAEILFTFGLAYLIVEFVVMVWGRNPIENRVPAAIDFPLFTLFGTTLSVLQGTDDGDRGRRCSLSLYLAFKRTRLGLIIRAALTHPQMVGALGHDVPRIFVLVFAIGSALAGLAGVIGGFALLTEPSMAQALGPDRVRRRRRRRPGLDLRRVHRVDADRHRPDLRGRARLFASGSSAHAARGGAVRFAVLRDQLDQDRAGGTADSLPAAGRDAHRPASGLAWHARDMTCGDDATARAWRRRPRCGNGPWPIASGSCAAALLLVLPFFPGLDGNFGRSLLSQMGIAAVFALSYNLLLGQTGLLSFGHAVYFGLGAYAGIHLMRAINAGLPIPMPLVPIAGAASGTRVRHAVRRLDDAPRRRRVRVDLSRRGRARLRRDAHVAGLFRRRGGHHSQSQRSARTRSG